jgi:hypothetical protein
MIILRYCIALLVTWVIFALGGALWHEVLFAEQYNEWVFGIERMELPVTYFLLTYLMRSMVFVYVYYMLYSGGNPLMKGLKYGFLMGMITGLAVTGYYGDFEIKSPDWVVLEFTFNMIRSILAGVLIALIIGEKGVKAA